MKKSDLKACFSAKDNLKALFTPPIRSHVPVLDSLRALSFHWVFGFHALYILRFFIPTSIREDFFEQTSNLTFFWRGTFGVDIFFVISGFLITKLLITEYQNTGGIDIPRFYKRRFLRLMPVYYFAILVIAVGYPPEYEVFQPKNGWNLWANLLYVNNFLSHDQQSMLWTWSLAIEEQFYLLFPIVFLFVVKFNKSGVLILCAVLVVSTVGRWWYVTSVPFDSSSMIQLVDVHSSFFDSIYDKLHFRIGAIICGILAAFWFLRFGESTSIKIRTLGKAPILAELLMLATLFCLVFFEDGGSKFWVAYVASFRTIFSIVLTLLLLLYLTAASDQMLFKRLLTAKFWYPLAQLSYGSYIWHPMSLFTFYFLFWRDDEYLSISNIIISISLSYFMTFLLSIGSFVYLEKPFMKMRGFL